MSTEEITDLPVPTMNVVAAPAQNSQCPITDQDLQNIYTEILDDLRGDRNEINALLNNFVEMVMNEGDSSSASNQLF